MEIRLERIRQVESNTTQRTLMNLPQQQITKHLRLCFTSPNLLYKFVNAQPLSDIGPSFHTAGG